MEPGRLGEKVTPEFQAMLERSIEKGLREVLGESGLQMVLRLHPLEGLSSDPARFHEVMTGIFLEKGAVIIEREIAQKLLRNAGRERTRRRARLAFLAGDAFTVRPMVKVSAKEKKVLRRFLDLSSLPGDHSSGPRNEAGGVTNQSFMAHTSLRFAAAFKKGS